MPRLGRIGRQRRCQGMKVRCSPRQTRQAHNWKRRSEARPIAAHMQRRAVRRRHQDAREALVRIASAISQWSSSLQMDGTTTFVPVAEARRVPP
jgi:hypothetical protein